MDTDDPLRRAKRPRTILAGPYGHPFHAMVITIPIGAWTASVVFDLVAIFGDNPEAFARGAAWLIGIGLVGGVVAAALGFLDYLQLQNGTRAHRTARLHMVLNLTVLLLMLISFIVRLAAGFEQVSVAGFVLSLMAMLLLAASGYLGGELSYRYGVRVADEDSQRKAYR
ncbi:DUF2231 domain-containing protein [Naasia sp. SYSU D00948]|uniref:DUF2231 domain-containing protein n=1 Tax=Naasia sp. SYSU D00948 TaxID=2817379 RepID=UPI001B31674C|nr:DUF2231 domain-containing protein [Naasia sp. SYSU D00948]